jgi:hypothetical protein
MTAEQPAHGQPGTFERSVHLQRLNAVMAASRIVPAHAVSPTQKPQPRRDAELIKSDEKNEDLGHNRDVEDSNHKFQISK